MYKIVKRMEKGKVLLYRVDYTEQGIKVTWDNIPDIDSKLKLGDSLKISAGIVHYCVRCEETILIDCIEQEFYNDSMSRIFYLGDVAKPSFLNKKTKSTQSIYQTPIPNIMRVKIAEKK